MPEIRIVEPSPHDETTLVRLRAHQCRFIVLDDGPEALFFGGRPSRARAGAFGIGGWSMRGACSRRKEAIGTWQSADSYWL